MRAGFPQLQWSVVSAPAESLQAQAIKAASPGVVHVCTCIMFSVFAGTGIAAGGLDIQLLDGATVIAQGILGFSAVAVEGGPLIVPNLLLPGTAGNTMTLQGANAVTDLYQRATLIGFDL